MIPTFDSVLWLLVALSVAVSIIGVVQAVRDKLREFEQREAHRSASRKGGRYRPNAERAAMRRSKRGGWPDSDRSISGVSA